MTENEGGRVRQIENHGFPPVDMGGEIIHGCYTKVYQLAEENKWDMEMLFDYEAENGLEWIYFDGKMYPYHSNQPDILAAYMAWGDFVYSNKPGGDAAKNDMTATEYFARHPKIERKSQHVFDVVFCQTEAANLDSFGAQEHSDFQNGWECGPGNFRLKNSHKQVIQHYVKRCEGVEIKLDWQAKEIDYEADTVIVTNHNGSKLKSQAVILCVPLTVLKDQDINFKPRLPEDKRLAIEKLQMFTGLKIVCRFKERFWPENMKLVFNCVSDICQLWMYDVLNEETGDQYYVVTGFQTAEYARLKAHMTGDEVKGILLRDLDEMFRSSENQTPATSSFIDYVYFHWYSNPFIRGAYSSPSVHARGSREILAKPVSDRVFFAGEATRGSGDCATISGALESGIKAAEDVKKILK
ncbi:polyamine oxidase 3-like isoform X2 [Dendronephthya gigantea]|uniref:polyamine oxidase 3-like isoform X2 n=1 Tax=Dendronephthya gigantea TaxID=151771 RepID=UPI001069E3E3|nr:polyamine oxidase 3-like isoform X2 [Dendronephthya gigantea]